MSSRTVPHPKAALSRPAPADLRAFAEALSVRELRQVVGYWLAANYADATGEGTLICPLGASDAVLPIPVLGPTA